ncbi:MAG: helix-turn-helix transcriptional regulator, partial [Clostridia bacterium]|nr:helix-turn-helix transcriptional regulator [Clostridia bacterium]
LRFSIEAPTGSKKQELHAYNTAKKLFSSPIKLHDENGNILRFIEAISNEIDNGRLGYITAMQSYSALLFTEIFRLMGDDFTMLFPADELALSGRDYFKIELLFNNNYSRSDMTANECAEKLNISRRQLDRIMYKLYGASFSENLKNTRLEKAVYLLKYSDETLIEISKECGFASYSAFYSSFKQKYQISPTEFRKTNACF